MSDTVLYDDDEVGEEISLESIDWDALTVLQAIYDEINAIEDPTERLEAAKKLVESFEG